MHRENTDDYMEALAKQRKAKTKKEKEQVQIEVGNAEKAVNKTYELLHKVQKSFWES